MGFVFELRRIFWKCGRAIPPIVLAACLGWFCAACGPEAPVGWGEWQHQGDILLASSAPGGGKLVAMYDWNAVVPVYESARIGSFALYTAAEPGFDLLAFSNASQGWYALPSGVTLVLEILELDDGAALKIEGELLSAPGHRKTLGTTPDLHAHPEWQVAAPVGSELQQYRIRFRLIAEGGGYESSDLYTATLQLSGNE